MTTSESLAVALTKLDQRLREWDAPIVEHLRPGVASSDVERALSEVGVTPTGELVELWGWHDGTDRGVAEWGYFDPCPENLLIGGWYLMGVHDAVWSYRSLHDLWEGKLPPSWMPVLDFIDAPVLCAETDPAAPDRGALFIVDAHADLPADPPRPFARSLLEFINKLLAIFDAGAIVADSPMNGGLHFDYTRMPASVPPSSYL